jgi:hypothetical protein
VDAKKLIIVFTVATLLWAAYTNPKDPTNEGAAEQVDLDDTDGCGAYTNAVGAPDVAAISRCRLMKSLDPAYCDSLPEKATYDRIACLTDLAGRLNDTAACGGLSGNSKTACEAAARNDLAMCARIPILEKRAECEMRLMESAPPRLAENCSGRAGEDLAWCLIYEAETEEECLLIDETAYPDEAGYCRAKAAGNRSMCGEVEDAVMRNMCKRGVEE